MQCLFFEWLTLSLPQIRKVTFAIPNGGSRNAIEGHNLKRQGVSKGVVDVYVSIPNKSYHGLYIEFKAPGRKLTTEQAEFFRNVMVNGYFCKVAYSFDQAKNLLLEYLDNV